MKQKIFYVEGMHCSACELIIEKKLLKLDGVEGVDASLKDGKVIVHSKEDLDYSIEDYNVTLKKLGYTAYLEKPTKKEQVKLPILYFVDGQQGLKFNTSEFVRRYEWFLILVAVFVGWKLLSALEVGRYMSPEGPETLFGVLVLGVVASVSSCAALIGGLLMSLTKQWHEKTLLESKAKKAAPHVQFHVGRLIGFTFFGAMLGGLGDVITLDNISVYAVLVLVVSVVMGILALQMLGVSWANKLRLTLPSGVANTILDHPKRGPLLIGAGTFFLPCGFTLIAQALALASGSLFTGGLVMGLFALGTLPVLLGISVFGLKMNTKPTLTARFNKYAGILILLFALYNVNGQLNVLGLPSMSDFRLGNVQEQQLDEVTQDQQGVQTIGIVAKGFRYTPSTAMTVQSGLPTQLVVDNQGIQGCGAFLAVAGLMDGFVSLKPGENIVDLGKPKPGTYKITCSMGMVAPVVLKVV